MAKNLLKASLVASVVFAVGWLRVPGASAFGMFLFACLFITILATVVGLPLAMLIERLKIGRWWSYLAFGVAAGALLGAILTPYPRTCTPPAPGEQETCIQNPHAIPFSPWTRHQPDFDDDLQTQWSNYLGSIAFGSLVGGSLALSFWFFYQTEKRAQA